MKEEQLKNITKIRNKDIILQKQREYAENNKEKILQRHSDYYDDNRDIILQKAKEYCNQNREKILQKRRDYYQQNREGIAAHKAEKIKCECGCMIARVNLAQHKRTKRHEQLLQTID